MPKDMYGTMDKLLFNTIIPNLEQVEWESQEDLDKAVNHLCDQLKEHTKDVLKPDD